jgi:TetR/AcrR family transcriptional regulator
MTASQLRRAHAAEEKSERRAAILKAAEALVRADPALGFSMEQLAKRAGIAKGTVYLYFGTREEVLLALHERIVHGLFDAFEVALDAPGADARSVLEAGCRYHREQPGSYALAGRCRSYFESGVGIDTAVDFKLALAPRIGRLGTRIESLIPGLLPGEGAALLMNSHALIVGLWQLADTPPRMRKAMQRAELAPMQFDFETQVIDALSDLWDGAARRGARRDA